MYCKSPNPFTISQSGILYAMQISDHMAIFAALNFKVNKTFNQIETICTRSFAGHKMHCFLGEFENINVFDQRVTADPFISYDQQLSTKLYEIINTHFPSKIAKFYKYKHKKSKWINYDLRSEIKKKDELYRAVNTTESDTLAQALKYDKFKIKVKQLRKLES